MPRAFSHWRYNTVCSAPARVRLQPEPRLPQHRWPGEDTEEGWRAGCHLSPRPRFVECIYLYLSKCLALVRKEKGWQRDVTWRRSHLRGLRWLGGWLRVMYGGHAGGLEFGEVEPKFAFHSGEGGCSEAVAPDVVCVDGRQLWDVGPGSGLRPGRTSVDQRVFELAFFFFLFSQMNPSSTSLHCKLGCINHKIDKNVVYFCP